MYRKIIVGYDGSDQSEDALALGALIAGESDARLVVAGVLQFDPIWGVRYPAFQQAEVDFSRQIEQAAASVGAEAETITSTSAGRGLHELAEELAADLIVIGSPHRGRVGQAVAGSVAMSLLHGSPCSVGVAPRGYSEGGERRITEIAVGVDGSDEARMALDEAVELARAGGVPIKLIAVAELPSVTYGKSGPAGGRGLEEAIEETMRRQLGGATESVPGDVRVEPVLATGEPAATLAELARADGALLMLGSRSYGPLRRVLLGSVSAALARSAPCPLIVHPRPAKAPARGRPPVAAASVL
ncbi:MAG TPA: universal stress protein [Thermoleophilaceae bacterium]|nr:universal stress protein [Thermoleophilaceae bacterium]